MHKPSSFALRDKMDRDLVDPLISRIPIAKSAVLDRIEIRNWPLGSHLVNSPHFVAKVRMSRAALGLPANFAGRAAFATLMFYCNLF